MSGYFIGVIALKTLTDTPTEKRPCRRFFTVFLPPVRVPFLGLRIQAFVEVHIVDGIREEVTLRDLRGDIIRRCVHSTARPLNSPSFHQW